MQFDIQAINIDNNKKWQTLAIFVFDWIMFCEMCGSYSVHVNFKWRDLRTVLG